MNLEQLIAKLQSLRNNNDSSYYDVLTHGSQPTTMVGVEDARIVKLKSGSKAVFIGKPKAERN